jgi:hypothetical protein
LSIRAFGTACQKRWFKRYDYCYDTEARPFSSIEIGVFEFLAELALEKAEAQRQ